MDKFVDRTKRLFARITHSGTVQKSVSTAKETAADLGTTASKVAADAAGKAKVTAANISDKARETARDVSEKTAPLTDLAALKAKDTAEAGNEPHVVPDVNGGLSESAQATVDGARDQADAFVRDAAVELESAPVDGPGDAVDVAAEGQAHEEAAEKVDTATRQAKTDIHQE